MADLKGEKNQEKEEIQIVTDSERVWQAGQESRSSIT